MDTINSNKIVLNHVLNRYVTCHKQIEKRMDGSAGGTLSAIFETLVRDDFYFSGAVWDDNLNVKHIVTNDPCDITRLSGYKPIESDLNNVYHSINSLLADGQRVVFCGTAKQCFELKQKVVDTSNLILIDIISAPLQKSEVIEKYKDYIEKKYGSKVKYIQFSNREFNNEHSKRILLENGRTVYIREADFFDEMEMSGNYAVPRSEYDCDFTNRVGDMSIGAYLMPNKENDHLGYTYLSVNSEAGQILFERLTKRISIVKAEDIDLSKIQIAPISFFTPASSNNFIKYFRAVMAGFKCAQWKIRPIYQFIKYNFFSSHVQTDIPNRGLIYIYPNSVFKLVKGCKIILHGPLNIGPRRIKSSSLETRLRMEKNSCIIVNESCSFGAGSNIEIYKNAILEVGALYSNAELNIICGEEIQIGSPCNIARNATVRDTSGHIISTPGYKQSKPIKLGNHTWICTESTIMPGVAVGDGAIVSACSFVTKKVSPFSIVQGSPAVEVAQVKYFHI